MKSENPIYRSEELSTSEETGTVGKQNQKGRRWLQSLRIYP